MNELRKQEYIDKLVEYLPMLRKKIDLTQKEHANIIGVSSYTILLI